MINGFAALLVVLMVPAAIFAFGKWCATGIGKKAAGGALGAFAAWKAAEVLKNSQNEKNQNSQNGTQANSAPNRNDWNGPFDANGNPVNH